MKAFDRQFGKEFISAVPPEPGIYRFYSEEGRVIYVGKARNLKRRLGQYRNAKRRKKHRKMKVILKDAARLDFQICVSELEALLLETRLIQELRPKWNISGAFYFLYPLIGLRQDLKRPGWLEIIYTHEPEVWTESKKHVQWYGAFRSREITGNAYFAMIRLLGMGFRRASTRNAKKKKRSDERRGYSIAFENVEGNVLEQMDPFFRGRSKRILEELILRLVDSPRARQRPDRVQEALKELSLFYRHEARRLSQALKRIGKEGDFPVSQKERDVIFLRARYEGISKGFDRPSV